ncbi:MAG: hypothetical protein BA873_03165 [Desulfobulbaceae bacterium C00003063]|nr:MAG: hypothetical protein BA873_03165 [Desulfobulbaceae bacterium C00003063]
MSFINYKDPEVTHDTLFDGELVCLQHKNGYRFSIDSVILAHFIRPDKGDILLDLGSGCGIISLIMGYRWKDILESITGVEKQSSLVTLAKRSIAMNGFDELCQVIKGDVKTLFQTVDRESFTKVICNPPFYQSGTGRINKNREALLARHQISATLADFISAAAAAVKNRGATYFIYPAQSLGDLLLLSKKHKLEPKKNHVCIQLPSTSKKCRTGAG